MNISHGCYSGPATQFDALRLLWALFGGYGLLDYRNQGGPVIPNLQYEAFSDEDLLGEWPNGAPEDPLIILLAHEEQKGRIKFTHCPFLAHRLEELEMKMMADNMAVSLTPAWILLTQQFARGLHAAASYRQDVVFS
jgi:hypothetical protein